MKTLMLLDGNSLVYRAFFALNEADMRTSNGDPTGAIYGFLTMLFNLIADHKPDGLAVAFDLPYPTFRHEKVDTYKAGRAKTPDDLLQQIPKIKEILPSMGIQTIELQGYEADDILATLATQAREAKVEATVITGDRDSYQLVEDPYIKVLYNRRGVSDYILFDEEAIKERTGVDPDDYVKYAALRGDKSDNLPGVPGVGEKTAAKLVNEFGTLDKIFESADQQTPKLKENLLSNENLARLNEEVMTLIRDVPLGVEVESLQLGARDVGTIQVFFQDLELRTLTKRLNDAFGEFLEIGDSDSGQSDLDLGNHCVTLADSADLVSLLDEIKDCEIPVSISASWVTGQDTPSGFALGRDPSDGSSAWFPFSFLNDLEISNAFTQFLQRDAGVVGHGLKPVIRSLLAMDLPAPKIVMDTEIGAYLLNPSRNSYLLNDLLLEYAKLSVKTERQIPDGQLDLESQGDSNMQQLAIEAASIALLYKPLEALIKQEGLEKLNNEIEVPLIYVLAEMEFSGIQVDLENLTSLRDQLESEASNARENIHKLAGQEFNVNSTKQLQQVLFTDLELEPRKKTKTGFSTDAQTLEKMKGDHPIIEELLEYREVEKLRSTYGQGLINEIDSDQRIRATFHQTVTVTGRLSSVGPNLHNIPVRTEKGKAFREVFVAKKNHKLLVADYNQIELRCIAHLSSDPGLIKAFNDGQDIHTATAARVFGIDDSTVTKAQREKAKMVSYGLAYGMEAYGLAQRLGIENREAAKILTDYFTAFPSVKEYMNKAVDQAKERGFTETLFGRKRKIPELKSSNSRVRNAAERQAMNAGIQGLAADIFKVALVNLNSRLKKENLKSSIILQVHDEVILECPTSELKSAEIFTIEEMGSAFSLQVPLEVNISSGSSWAEAK
jgi:DNA polymerase-1